MRIVLAQSALALGMLALVMGSAVARSAVAQTRNERQATVGMRARIEQIVLPGSELKVKPLTQQAPIVLRILETWRHGTDFRYDLEYYGLEPGKHDLARYLERADGKDPTPLAPIEVTITPLLPRGQVEPIALTPRQPPSLGGYHAWLIAGGIVWVAGLLAILFAGRRRHRDVAALGNAPRTLADRLRPMVTAAAEGRLDSGGKAELERLLLAFWRRRLGLEAVKAGPAIVRLREHPEAGALLRQLEAWLHRPGASGSVDVSALLAPYRSLPADAVDAPQRAPAGDASAAAVP